MVYAAREHGTNRVVALKRIASGFRLTPLILERVHREIRRIQDIRHPGIVPIHEFLVEGEDGIIITEFAPGQSLADRLRQRGALSVDEVVTLGIALAGTLAVAHDAGIVHRDIKPENVMLGQLAGPRLTDFSSTSPAARHASPVSVPDHPLSPDAVRDRKAGRPGDAREDIYGLGLTLYVALVNEVPPGIAPGVPAVPGPSGFHPSQAAAGSSVPRWLDEVIARATAARPGDRYPDARAFLHALEGVRSRNVATRLRVPGDARGIPHAMPAPWPPLADSSPLLIA